MFNSAREARTNINIKNLGIQESMVLDQGTNWEWINNGTIPKAIIQSPKALSH